MTTRSLIGMQHGDGSITAIYCQCDGYPSYNGKVLRDHYTDGVQVEELMALCEIDVLGQTPAAFMDDAEKRRDIDKNGYPPSKTAAASTYGKNDAMQAAVYVDRDAFVEAARGMWAEYVYLFVNDAWSVRDLYDENTGWAPIDESISKD